MMMRQTQYTTGKCVKTRVNISTSTLQRLAIDGSVYTIKTPGGKRLYSLGDIERMFKLGPDYGAGRRVSYARVSSHGQRDDLERQTADLRRLCPDHEVVTDIGSELNWKRKAFKPLLDAAF